MIFSYRDWRSRNIEVCFFFGVYCSTIITWIGFYSSLYSFIKWDPCKSLESGTHHPFPLFNTAVMMPFTVNHSRFLQIKLLCNYATGSPGGSGIRVLLVILYYQSLELINTTICCCNDNNNNNDDGGGFGLGGAQNSQSFFLFFYVWLSVKIPWRQRGVHTGSTVWFSVHFDSTSGCCPGVELLEIVEFSFRRVRFTLKCNIFLFIKVSKLCF